MKHLCRQCGMVEEAEELPENCRQCGHPANFERVEEEAGSKEGEDGEEEQANVCECCGQPINPVVSESAG